ncbi:E7 protein [Mustela putorius papillomavirus 1]|uniref:Protein E7 n=1 Tax=Mustela putorius papillomavirus 1 TaxID=2259540 RepID=T1YDG8_9PAPI|nr:E7 protein [Mustela putorius papillomavirus 1]AGU62950.1 E7 protein [Mustela putorius papillomavirus 1]
MIGNTPTIKDVDLDLQELVLPDNLLANETIDAEEEVEPEPQRYRVVTSCNICHNTLRLFVQVAEESLIRGFQQLLLQGLGIVCPECYRTYCKRDGGR